MCRDCPCVQYTVYRLVRIRGPKFLHRQEMCIQGWLAGHQLARLSKPGNKDCNFPFLLPGSWVLFDRDGGTASWTIIETWCWTSPAHMWYTRIHAGKNPKYIQIKKINKKETLNATHACKCFDIIMSIIPARLLFAVLTGNWCVTK